MGSQAGFTLIEIIVTLILVGILASAGGMAIVHAVQGYMVARDNSETTQKAQMAISRITREIVEMINIPSDATATALPINNVNGNRTIGLDSGAVKMAFGTDPLSSGDILIDNVNTFTLTYFSVDASTGAVTTASSWAATNDITTLTAIDVNLQINRAGGGTLSFAGNRVAPRNNKNQGGAAPSTPPPSAPTYGSGCFVATAAYGNPAHPMVQLLREFRDRFLLHLPGGGWLVKQYCAYGPTAAELIRNRPIAKGVARWLLAPVAALTFFLLYAPLALLLILPVSLILTCAIFSLLRRGAILLRSGLLRPRGSILIGLIATMTIMAVLGAAMLHLFSAANMNQVYADQGRKTYFLAESGFRYAASQFLNAGTEAARLTAMTAMNNKTCVLLNNAGSFTTRVYPYWFKSQAAAAGATTLSTQVYGTVPAEFTGSFSGGQIRLGSSYYSYSSGSGSGTTVTFSGLSPALPVTAVGVDVQPVTQPGSTQNLSKSGSLTLSSTGSGVFPLLNGNFILNPSPSGIPSGAVFNYDKRSGTTLFNVTLSDGNQNANWTSAVSVPSTTKVVLDKYLRLSSTGSLGSATREVVYNIPVGWIAGGGQEITRQQYTDPMNAGTSWFTGQDMGTHTVTGGAMSVSSVVDPTGASGLGSVLAGLLGWTSGGYWGFVALDWSATNTNLAQAWMDANGCLSYDLQVKMNNTENYFMTGIGFRMRNNTDTSDLHTYGVSFIRQRETRSRTRFLGAYGSWSAWDFNDGIDPALRPFALGYAGISASETIQTAPWFLGTDIQARYSEPAILLWQRNGPATGTGNFKILAYRTITSADGLTTGSGTSLVLKPWSTLLVRLMEGYALPFSSGRNDTGSPAHHIKYGDTIKNAAGTKSARIIGTPVVSSGTWASGNAAGTLILSNLTGGAFSAGETLYLQGGVAGYSYALAGTQAAAKANFIMVYYSDNKTPAAGNTAQADNTRIGNPRDSFNWPPDDWTDRTAANDYFSLVGSNTTAIQWTSLDTSADGYGHSASFVAANSATELYRAVIRTDALVSPAWTSSSVAADFNSPGDAIALVTSSSAPNTANTTYYDDFGIQLDLKAGTGFLPPIQQ
jgi:prepilin-type N-terminal cleavage/methylation domain-containing protein